MLLNNELIIGFINIIQLYIVIIAFTIIISEIVDSSWDKPLKEHTLHISTYLLVLGLISFALEHFNTIVKSINY